MGTPRVNAGEPVWSCVTSCGPGDLRALVWLQAQNHTAIRAGADAGKRECSYGADCSLVDGLGRVALVGRCCLRESVGYVRRLFECCRIILLKPGVWRPASGWAGCLRAVVMDAQTCLSRPAFRRRDAVALLRRPSALSARRVIASGTWPTSKECNDTHFETSAIRHYAESQASRQAAEGRRVARSRRASCSSRMCG